MGADRRLVRWNRVVAWFDAAAAASNRIRVERIGTTVRGRPMIAAFLSDAETLRNLDRYRDIQARLADPRRTPAPDAERLIQSGKSVVMITCSVHSTEVASTMTALEYAHRLITVDTARHRAILANTIFILVPSLNPDGVEIVADWYTKTLRTDFEGTEPPELYHHYIGHDNNRDWYIFSQPETRAVITRLHNVWHPHIVYDVHQQGPYAARTFVPPWADPIEPNIDAILVQLCNSVGAAMAADLTSAGKTGVVVNATYDFWTPARHYQAYHGGLRILSETASPAIASPLTVRPEQIRRDVAGYNPRVRSWNYLEPWLGGVWRLRDVVDYQLIMWESCLYQAATRREDLIRAMWRVNDRASRRASPYAFVVPERQRDPGAARRLLETLAFGMVEIGRAAANFRAGNAEYPAGTYIIRMQQPYSSWAKTLLEEQDYPGQHRPYDVTANTLPLLMGVKVDAIPYGFTAEVERVGGFAFRPLGPPGADTDFYRNAARLQRGRRIGIYRSWVPNIDEGWTRWLLDRFGFRYARLTDAEIRAGNLNSRVDVLILPDASPESMAEGHKSGTMPSEYTGGLGENGAQALRDFVENGGTLLCFNRSSEYAIDRLRLPVRAINGEHVSPGSILQTLADVSHPLASGLPKLVHIWNEGSPAFEASRGREILTYPEGNILASGWLAGERTLRRKAAMVELPLGNGRVILYGFRPQYRGQSYGTFKLLFNALLP